MSQRYNEQMGCLLLISFGLSAIALLAFILDRLIESVPE